MWSIFYFLLAYIEVYDYEVYALRETPNSIELRIEMCYLTRCPNMPFLEVIYQTLQEQSVCCSKGSLPREGDDIQKSKQDHGNLDKIQESINKGPRCCFSIQFKDEIPIKENNIPPPLL